MFAAYIGHTWAMPFLTRENVPQTFYDIVNAGEGAVEVGRILFPVARSPLTARQAPLPPGGLHDLLWVSTVDCPGDPPPHPLPPARPPADAGAQGAEDD